MAQWLRILNFYLPFCTVLHRARGLGMLSELYRVGCTNTPRVCNKYLIFRPASLLRKNLILFCERFYKRLSIIQVNALQINIKDCSIS